MGRRCKTLLPMSESLLVPNYNTRADIEKMKMQKEKQAFYYDRGSKKLSNLKPQQSVRIKTPGQRKWSRGVCLGKAGLRSYDVEVNGQIYRRNRRHLLDTMELPIADNTIEDNTGTTVTNENGECKSSTIPESTVCPSSPSPTSEWSSAAFPRRSTRTRKQTDFYESS